MTLAASEVVLVEAHDLLVLDLDGVVYVGHAAVPGAVEALVRAERAGAVLRYVTNNASRTPSEVADHLRALGLPATPEEVVTSSQAAAALVRAEVGPGAAVLAVGGPGVSAALEEAGLRPVLSADDGPAAVVQGYGRTVGWPELAEAAFAVRAGALWVATNTDATLPTARGPAPGNGSLVAAVRTATGRAPTVAGKPEPALFRLAAGSASSPLAVGDRTDTDVAAGRRAGIRTLLVLTGVTAWRDLLCLPESERPDLLGRDLAALHVPHPAVLHRDGRWRCAAASADIRDGVLELEVEDPGADGLDPLRAAAAAAWQASDRALGWRLGEEAQRRLQAAVAGGR